VKLNLSRQTLYMLVIALLLLIIVFLFSFLFLIPKGKEYRIERMAMKKEFAKEREYQQWYDETHAQLQQLRSDHKHVIEAFENRFEPKRFIALYQNRFDALSLTPMMPLEHNATDFELFEVNTTSRIDSPQVFYDFLDQINKSEWIINVNFPIHFEREGEMIRSSFSMEVYTLRKKDSSEANASASS